MKRGKFYQMTTGKHNKPDPVEQSFSNNQLLTGRILRRYREIQGISQSSLAMMTSTNVSTISSLECGKCNISIKNAEKICNALGSSSARLINIQKRIATSKRLSKLPPDHK
jgi:transcriptional regulator with XRE-family HTH domain